MIIFVHADGKAGDVSKSANISGTSQHNGVAAFH